MRYYLFAWFLWAALTCMMTIMSSLLGIGMLGTSGEPETSLWIPAATGAAIMVTGTCPLLAVVFRCLDSIELEASWNRCIDAAPAWIWLLCSILTVLFSQTLGMTVLEGPSETNATRTIAEAAVGFGIFVGIIICALLVGFTACTTYSCLISHFRQDHGVEEEGYRHVDRDQWAVSLAYIVEQPDGSTCVGFSPDEDATEFAE